MSFFGWVYCLILGRNKIMNSKILFTFRDFSKTILPPTDFVTRVPVNVNSKEMLFSEFKREARFANYANNNWAAV